MRRTKGLIGGLLTAAAISICIPAGARAGEVIGANLDLFPNSFTSTPAADDGTIAPDIQLLTVGYEGDLAPGGLTADAAGVVTRFRVKTAGTALPPGEVPLSLRFRILTWNNAMANDTFTGAGTSDPSTVLIGSAGIQPFPVRLPILAGQTIGYSYPSGAAPRYSNFNYDSGGVNRRSFLSYEIADGEGPLGFGQLHGQPLLDATIEPDADHDTYGDETQDLCPTDATRQGPCTIPAPPGSGTAKKKCKRKKAKKTASAAKKKCKKRKK